MAKRKLVPTLKQEADEIISFLRDGFASADEILRTAVLPSGSELSEAVYRVWAKSKDNPASIGEVAFDIIETANCGFENGHPDVFAHERTERHGSLRDATNALAGSAPAPTP